MANDFNPRAHEGHDVTPLELDGVLVFQSTCPRGARPTALRYTLTSDISIHVPTRGTTRTGCTLQCGVYFNPRAHEGHDLLVEIDHICLLNISIHVPTRGTTMNLHLINLNKLFQSTCPRGARLLTLFPYFLTIDFNPRAHEGHDAHRRCSCGGL